MRLYKTILQELGETRECIHYFFPSLSLSLSLLYALRSTLVVLVPPNVHSVECDGEQNRKVGSSTKGGRGVQRVTLALT